VQGPGKSWNFLGYDDVGGGPNDAGADLRVRTSLLIVPLSKYSLLHISTA